MPWLPDAVVLFGATVVVVVGATVVVVGLPFEAGPGVPALFVAANVVVVVISDDDGSLVVPWTVEPGSWADETDDDDGGSPA